MSEDNKHNAEKSKNTSVEHDRLTHPQKIESLDTLPQVSAENIENSPKIAKAHTYLSETKKESVELTNLLIDTSLPTIPSSNPQLNTDNSILLLDEKTCEQIFTKLALGIDKFSTENHPIVPEIIHQLKIIKSKEINYPSYLREIVEFISARLKAMADKDETDPRKDLPTEFAWLLWKHSSLERVQFHHQKPSNKAHQLLNLAQNGIEFTNKLLYRGGDTDLKFNTASKQEQQTLSEGMHYLHEEMDNRREVISVHLETLKEERSVELAIRTHLAEREHLGNCVEKSAVLANFFLNLGDSFSQYGVKAEIFSIKNGDHSFVVLGRKPGSNPNDYTTWGEDAVICDPWLDIAYFPQDLPNHLASYEDGDENRLEPFHPFNHGLKVYQKDAVAALKEGYNILHEHDLELSLEHAVKMKDIILAKKIMQKFADNRDTTNANSMCEKLLKMNCDEEFFKICIKHLSELFHNIPGFDLNLKNTEGYTALELAALSGNMEVCEILLAAMTQPASSKLDEKATPHAHTLESKNLLESKKNITQTTFSKGIHPEVSFRVSDKLSSFFSFKTLNTPDPILLVKENKLAEIPSSNNKTDSQLPVTPQFG